MATGSITSLGLGSSIDLQGMLDIQREADEKILGLKLKDIDGQTAIRVELNSVRNQLLSMKTRSLNLSLASNYLYRSVFVSDTDMATATANDGAKTGSHRVETIRLASSSSYISEGAASATAKVYVPTVQESTKGVDASAIVLAEGDTLEISYGSQDDPEIFTITGAPGGMTASDLVTAINSDTANQDRGGSPLVTASTYTDEEGNTRIRIKAASGDTGEENRVKVSGADIGFTAPGSELSFKLGDESGVYAISIPPETTLEGLAERINSDENNPGVTATIINTGTGDNPYQLVLEANDSGENSRIMMVSSPPGLAMNEKGGSGYTMTGNQAIFFDNAVIIDSTNNTIVFQEDSGDGYGQDLTAQIQVGTYDTPKDLAKAVETALEKESKRNGNEKDYRVTIDADTGKMSISEAGTLKGLNIKWGETNSTAAFLMGFSETMEITPADSSLNAMMTADGITYQRQDNKNLTDVITGVTLSLYSAGTTTININAATTTVKDDITSLVETYNALIKEIDANDDYDEDTGTWGTLAQSSTTRTMKQSLQGLFSTTVDTGGSITSLMDLGIKINRDGTLTLNENTLSQQLSKNFEGVKALLLGSDTATGLADTLNDAIGDYALSDGYIGSEIDVIDERISRQENNYKVQMERLEKKYDLMAHQYAALDTYLSGIKSTQSYLEQMLSSRNKED